MSGRDQKNTELALQTLAGSGRPLSRTRTMRATPRSRSISRRDHLAGKEMTIGRFYQSRDQYLAAINRYRRVIELYQTTTHVPEALQRLTECYLALGVYDEAQTAAAVLGYNYPGHRLVPGQLQSAAGARPRAGEEERLLAQRAF